MADEKAWCKFDEDISMMLENTLKGTSKRKLEVKGDMIYDCGRVRFGIVETQQICKLQQRPAPTPSRHQKEISRLRKELRSLRHLWKGARTEEKPGLAELREQARSKLASLQRTETQRRKRNGRERSGRSFYDNPHRFTKKLFEQSTSGELNVSQQQLEEHLKNTYSDQQHGVPMPVIAGLVRPTKPGVEFDLSEPKLAEVEKFISKARAASAPGPNGVPYTPFSH